MSPFEEYIPRSREDEHADVPCPNCGHVVAVQPVTVLRPGDEALTELFAGELNTAVCDACDTRFLLDVPVLFRDDDARYMVYFMPLKGDDTWRDAEAGMAELAAKVFADLDDEDTPDYRLVISRSGLIEKIALHLRGFDDRVVEYIKFQFFNNPDPGRRLDGKRQRLLFDFSSQNGDNLTFIVFDREAGRASAGAHIPMDDYHEVAEMLLGNANLVAELKALFPGAYVNVDRLL